MKISVIVPIFNAEKNLEKCIDSLVNQTYSDLEIILIDDGSLDRSGKMCECYASKYADKIKIIHQNNEGVSAARNKGIENATGDLIGFVDSDDYVDTDMFQKLSEKMYASEFVDMVMCGFRENGKRENKVFENGILNATEALKYIVCKGCFKGYVWNKLFKKDVLARYKIRFSNKLHMCEDLVFCVEYLECARQVNLASEILYNYENRVESISGRKFNVKRLSVLEAYDFLISVECIKRNEKILNEMQNRQIKHGLSLWNTIYRNKKIKNRRNYLKLIKRRIKMSSFKYVYEREYDIKSRLLFVVLKIF